MPEVPARQLSLQVKTLTSSGQPEHGKTSFCIPERALLFLDQIKREKGVWWMPWQQEAMKDVIPCDKLREAGNGL